MSPEEMREMAQLEERSGEFAANNSDGEEGSRAATRAVLYFVGAEICERLDKLLRDKDSREE